MNMLTAGAKKKVREIAFEKFTADGLEKDITFQLLGIVGI